MKKSSKRIGACLPNIMPTQSSEDLTNQKSQTSGNYSATTGKPPQRTPASSIGLKLGATGSLMLANGQIIKTPIIRDKGIAQVPRLTQQQGLLIKREVYNVDSCKGYEQQHTLRKVDPNEYGAVYIQGMAALTPCPFEQIIVLLGELKILKAGTKLSEEETMIFLKKYANLIQDDELAYFAVKQGIDKYLLTEKDSFFPSYATLRGYIYPIHHKLKRQMMTLKGMLE